MLWQGCLRQRKPQAIWERIEEDFLSCLFGLLSKLSWYKLCSRMGLEKESNNLLMWIFKHPFNVSLSRCYTLHNHESLKSNNKMVQMNMIYYCTLGKKKYAITLDTYWYTLRNRCGGYHKPTILVRD